jgi:hypothetical protein
VVSFVVVQALGYLSVNDTFDLNIVIRTAVFVDQPADPSATDSSSSSRSCCRVMTVGAGGAITVQSDPEAEFAEMQLKAERLLTAAAIAQQPQQQEPSSMSGIAVSAQSAAAAAPASPVASPGTAAVPAAVKTAAAPAAADQPVGSQQREAVRR